MTEYLFIYNTSKKDSRRGCCACVFHPIESNIYLIPHNLHIYSFYAIFVARKDFILIIFIWVWSFPYICIRYFLLFLLMFFLSPNSRRRQYSVYDYILISHTTYDISADKSTICDMFVCGMSYVQCINIQKRGVQVYNRIALSTTCFWNFFLCYGLMSVWVHRLFERPIVHRLGLLTGWRN